jgi:DNA-binding transcriptional LysR family regulator
MELRELRYLVAIADEGSISRAADRLHMTQPPLSMAITKLERDLAVQLLERHAKGVRPTAAGTYLVANARRLLAEVEELGDMVRAVSVGSIGVLALAVTPAIAWEHAPTLLQAFARAAPLADVELIQRAPNEVLDSVHGRRAEVGLLYCADTAYLARANSADLNVALLRQDPLRLVLPVGQADPEAHLDIADLAGERWVLPWTQVGFPGLAEIVQAAWQRAGMGRPRTRNVGTLQEALLLVQAGLGVAVMPEAVTRIASDRVVVVRPKQPFSPLEAALVWRRNEAESPVLRQFLDVARSTAGLSPA